MLELKPNCAQCNKKLSPTTNDAVICSFECTFCRECSDGVLKQMCPNCGGNLCERPARRGV